MSQKQKEGFDLLEVTGYLPGMRNLIRQMCAPLWWHAPNASGESHVLHNGTMCVLHTGARQIGVTNDHVYAQYLKDRAETPGLVCQLGGTTIELEQHIIAREKTADLATFEIPSVLLGLAGVFPHHPTTWPTPPIRERETVILGGFPGALREEKHATLETGFQVLALAVTAVSSDKVILHLNMPNVHWPFHPDEQMNSSLGGMSGGGVYRVIEGKPIDRVELVGFIYEYTESLDVLFARPGQFIAADGQILFEA